MREISFNKLRKTTLMLALSIVRSVSLTLLISIGAAFAQDPTATAPAPPCAVEQKLEFRYDDGRSFTRKITGRENDLCVVNTANKSYYDKDWVL